MMAGTFDVRDWQLTLVLLAGQQVQPPEPQRPGPARRIRASDAVPLAPAAAKPDQLVSPTCWCRLCDMAANAGWLSRLSLCPDCGDKECPRSGSHDAKCAKAPPGRPGRPRAAARG